MELQGTITKINDIQTFASGFQKRDFVLTTEEQYPQPILIELLKDKIDLIDAHKVGDKVTVGINIRGREWISPQGDEKYFNSITGWKILSDPKDVPVTEKQAVKNEPAPKAEPTEPNNLFEEDDDDLPF